MPWTDSSPLSYYSSEYQGRISAYIPRKYENMKYKIWLQKSYFKTHQVHNGLTPSPRVKLTWWYWPLDIQENAIREFKINPTQIFSMKRYDDNGHAISFQLSACRKHYGEKAIKSRGFQIQDSIMTRMDYQIHCHAKSTAFHDFIAVGVGWHHKNKLLRMITTKDWLWKQEEYEGNVRSEELHIK